METKYSIIKIIKNKIGYTTIFFFILPIVLSILMLFQNLNKNKLILLLLLMIIIFLGITIYVIISVIKIIYFFKIGIETKAHIFDNTYITTGKRAIPLEYLGKDLEQTGNKFAYKENFGRKEFRKTGAVYEYKINGEVYQSSSEFIINGDTMFLKKGSIITVLVNPKNKNEAIIKDIFIKKPH